MKKTITAFIILITSLTCSVSAQSQTISGLITDKNTSEPQAFVNIIIKGTTIGTTTGIDGKFTLEVDFGEKESITLQASFVGYGVQEITVLPTMKTVDFSMESTAIIGQEVVVSASRVSESIMEAPADIQKINAKEIQSASSGDYYQSLGNLKGIDIVTSSLGFKTVNMRGFNTTSPFRSVQFIDGMDNAAPGLNFPIGNLVGASELDIESIEIISGAASALYGANAFQGVVNMTTKDPFKYQGLDVMVKGGTQNYLNGDLRYAKVLGEKKKLAVKVTASYLSANDWVASDSTANLYGDIETELDLTKIVIEKQYDQTESEEDLADFAALNTYLGFYPAGYPGKLDVEAPGYMEAELVDPKVQNLKTGLGVYYNFTDSLKIHYLFRYGMGNTIYQGTNRYSLNNFSVIQNKVELSGKNWFVKGYTTNENTGKSYDLVFTAINISKEGIADYASDYLEQYFNTMEILTNDFDLEAEKWMADSSHKAAIIAAQNSWIGSDSEKFDSLYAAIIDNPDLQEGSKFLDKSSLQHVEGQYNFNWKAIDLIAGASFRRYNPQSYGTIFSDTLVNPGDTLTNGRNDPKAEYVDISSYEYGAYAQATKKILNDKLKLMGSMRVDKNKNYSVQYSPRASVGYSWKDHNFRISAQQAFRAPTLVNQYIFLDLGVIKLLGTLDGVNNLYTKDSGDEFLAWTDSTDVNGNFVGKIDPSILEPLSLDPVEPEQVKSLEIGYRGIIFKGFYADVSAYYNVYTNFIGRIRVYGLLNDSAVAGELSGVNAMLGHSAATETYEIVQYYGNAKTPVKTYGTAVGLVYYVKRNYKLKLNYTFSKIDTSGLDDDLIPGFNTPKHKINVGLEGKEVWKQLGFGINYKWTDSFFWQSSFGDGNVPSYKSVDLQLNYELNKYNSIARIGVANLLGQDRIEAYGAPTIGRFIYASMTYKIR